MNEPSVRVTDAEWEVMRTVWANASVTSKNVVDILEEKTDWKKATIKTYLGRLVSKGALITETEGRKYIYSPAVTEEEMVKAYIEDILSRVCNKLAGKVINQLISEVSLSHNDLDNLKSSLIQKERVAVDEVVCECVNGQCECHLH